MELSKAAGDAVWVAAALEGRLAVGVDRNPEAIEVTLERLRGLPANNLAKG